MAEKKGTLPPLEVSPLIKAVRWTCLISGIVYGIVKQRQYSELERALRKQEEETRAAREEHLAREKRIRDEAELKELERIFLGTDPSNEAYSNGSSISKDNGMVSDNISKEVETVAPKESENQ